MKLNHRLRTVAATALLTVAGCSGALALASSSLAATSSGTNGPRAAVQCRINFQASSLNLRIGQDLVLSWTAVGADKLTASWTTGFVPFVGAVTTTMTKAGTFSYQVTGTSNGLYCGGAGVDVKFTGAATTSSTAPKPAPSTSTHSVTIKTSGPSNDGGTTTSNNGGGGAGTTGGNGGGNGNGNGNNGGGNGNNGGNGGGGNGNGGAATNNGGGFTVNTGASRTAANGYPVQSPTSGTGVAWYRDPLHLLAISALALIGSLVLWRREQLRAVFIRRH